MKNFAIPKPCQQNWENMLPDEKGKFCNSCVKSVYDFTQSSSAEIKDIYDAENGNICGRFQKEQLFQPSIPQNLALRFQRFAQNKGARLGMVMAVAGFLLSATGCTKKSKGEILTTQKDKNTLECKKESINQDFLLGDVEIVHRDSAQLKVAKKIPLPTKIIEPPKYPDYPEYFVTGEPVFVQDTLQNKNP